MKIPVSLPTRNDVVIDIIKVNDRYSATCGEVVNGCGMSSQNNWMIFHEKDENISWDPVVLYNTTIKGVVVPSFVRDTFEEALKECINYVYSLYNLKTQ